MKIKIPKDVKIVLDQLQTSGYEAYIVGGCVRDSILGIPPYDWDIATSARPEEILECFRAFRVIETGIKHGTVTVLVEKRPVEVTTFRIDGAYTDNRRPDQVYFTQSIKEDLARRDFTINAMAYSEQTGVVDYFSGQEDIHKKQVRCVGLPNVRFQEDGLRIMRGLRFASVMGFEIERETKVAIYNHARLLKNIAAERIASELLKMLCGKSVGEILRYYPEVLAVFLPEIIPMTKVEQIHPYHIYNVWEHTAKAVESATPDPIVRLTLLLHDIGKPDCHTTDSEGVDHFPHHQSHGATMAETILKRLKFDAGTIKTVYQLVLHHDDVMEPTKKSVRKWLNKLGEVNTRRMLEVKRGDISGQNPQRLNRLKVMDQIETILEEVLMENSCFSLKDLAVKGEDLIELGIPQGKEVGWILEALLGVVIEEHCENEKEKLLQYAKESGHFTRFHA